MSDMSSWVWTLLHGAWWVLSLIYSIPVVGTLAAFATIVLLYLLTPRPLKALAAPYLWKVTGVVRRFIVRILAEPGSLSHHGPVPEKIVYRDRNPLSMWQRLTLRMRWMVVGAATVYVWQYRAAWWPYVAGWVV